MTGAVLAPVAGATGTPTAPHDPYTRTELFCAQWVGKAFGAVVGGNREYKPGR